MSPLRVHPFRVSNGPLSGGGEQVCRRSEADGHLYPLSSEGGSYVDDEPQGLPDRRDSSRVGVRGRTDPGYSRGQDE